MFDAILFDLDGTLVDFVEADTQSLKWLHTLVCPDICFDDFLETAVDEIMNFHGLVAENEIDPLLMHQFRLQNTFSKYNLIWKQEYVRLYQKKLSELSIPFKGVEELLRKTKAKVKTGLITNAYDKCEQMERIKSAGLEIYFDVIIVAGEIGIYKPNPAIFLSALNHLNVSPEKALFIGDSLAYDILGAKSAGLKTVLFNQNTKRNSIDANYCVHGINELQILFDQIIL